MHERAWVTFGVALLLCYTSTLGNVQGQAVPGQDEGCLIVRQSADLPGTAFVDVTVIPMDRETLLQKQTVLVRGCRIEVMGHRDSVAIPAGYEQIVGGDDIYLVPGLVESHTHLRYDGDLTLYLSEGVTTVRNMEGSATHLRWKEEVRAGLFGPRILTAGPTTYAGSETAEEVRRAVDSIAVAGYDFLKVFDPLPRQTFEWLLDAAGGAGIPVAGHIPREVGARAVLELQSHQTIEHAEQFVYHWFYNDLDATRIPELVEQVKQSGAAVTPTLEVVHSWISVADAPGSLLTRAETNWLHPETYAYWHTFARGSSFENRLIAEFQNKVIEELVRQDVPLLVGSDTYMLGLNGPWALRREMGRMQEAGLSTFQVLRAATATPAGILGYDAGTVTEGRLADLLLVRGNPLQDLSALDAIEGVMLDGIWHPRDDLVARIAAVEAAYRPGNAFVEAALSRNVDRAIAAHRALRASGNDQRTDPEVIEYVASILGQNGRLEDALLVFELALEESEESASAHEGTARTLLALGRVAEAVARLEDALEIDPERSGARALLAQLRN
jgi:imidazolonepropionase-like amidohydrolase